MSAIVPPFARVKPGGYSVGAKVGSSELTRLDADHAASPSFAQAVSAALDNWFPKIDPTTIVSGQTFEINTICWDAAGQTWNAHIYNGSSAGTIVHSLTGGRTWLSRLSGPNFTLVTMCANAGVLVYQQSNSITKIAANAANTTTTTTIPDTSTRNAGTSWWSPTDSLYYLYVVNNNSGASYNLGTLVTTPDGVALTQHACPGAFVSGAQNYGATMSAQSAASSFALVAIAGAAAGTDPSHLMKVATSGTSLSDVTPAILTGKIVVGLEWDAVNALWLLLAFDGTNTLLYSSSDASTWTLVHTFSSTHAGSGFRAVGGVWAAVLQCANPYMSATTATYQVWLSADLGSTWHQTFSDPLSVTPPGFGAPSVLLSSGNALLMGLTSQAQASQSIGLT